MQPLPERAPVSPAEFASIRAEGAPVVLRGLVADWPSVRTDDLLAYLGAQATDEPVPLVRAAPDEEGRLHYDDALRGPNFTRTPATLRQALAAVRAEADKPRPDTVAIQGIATGDVLPGFAGANPLPLLPPEVEPRVWIGTTATVATHCDPRENIACVVAGRRRFTLFPPEQVGNLYMGPFYITPAGTPVSMVHLAQPDLARYPRFADALAVAQTAELAPGDALYIPYGWYHHVEALAPVNMLVNYWWDPARADVGSPWDALMHGMMTLRNLSPDQRRAWRAMFDQYVFLTNGDPAAHLPDHARGVMAATSPRDVEVMRRGLIATLQRVAAGG